MRERLKVMGRVSNWLSGLFGGKAKGEAPALPENICANIYIFSKFARHVPSDTPFLKSNYRQQTGQSWRKIGQMIENAPYMSENENKHMALARALHEIADDLMWKLDENVTVSVKTLKSIKENKDVFLPAIEGYKNAERNDQTNVCSLNGKYLPASVQLEIAYNNLDVFFLEADTEILAAKKPAQMISVRMPRPGR